MSIGSSFDAVIHAHALKAFSLLKQLIAIPSFSKEENKAADCLYGYLEKEKKSVFRQGNNIWVQSKNFKEGQPTILLNSHHDTVKPAATWTLNPFQPIEKNGQLFGLGSNDAGGPLVALLHTFLILDNLDNQPYNLIFAATAEEEISGQHGIAQLLPELGNIDLGIVGEPTSLRMAIAEKGLMVIDAVVKGVSGHAARNEGINAIYLALEDIQWLKNYKFSRKSETLGEINIAVTQINAGKQHNVVPDTCEFVIDVRTHEQYTNSEVFDVLRQHTHAVLTARSFRLNASGIALDHPVVQRGLQLHIPYYGSPTLSDQALMSGFPTLKIGPGDSARSHTADEYIFFKEIKQGIELYVQLLKDLRLK